MPITSSLPLQGILGVAHAADTKPVTIAIGTDIDSLDPDKYASWNDYLAYGNMFEGLYGADEKGNLSPGLAESVDIHKDGLAYTFTCGRASSFTTGIQSPPTMLISA